MKLIRCHIENFGVLSDFDFAFDDGLTIIVKVTALVRVPLLLLSKLCSMDSLVQVHGIS